MGRAKLPRKSTFIDMTAMCDVAFLLLSFFILTTKFKPDETIEVSTPSSVATKPVPEKNAIMMTLDERGRAFLSFTDDLSDVKRDVIKRVSETKNLGLSDGEVEKLVGQPIIGMPFLNLKQQSELPKNDLALMPGIPIKDSANNEMRYWIGTAGQILLGTDPAPSFLIKGDNLSKFPQFKNMLLALTDNQIFKFSMVTNPKGAPEGTDLYIKQLRGGTSEEKTE